MNILARNSAALTAMVATLLLAACGGTPPPPDWKLNAVSLIEHFQNRWLEGDSKAADLALDKARREVARSGRLDLLARLELNACATRAASLVFEPCAAYDALAAEATPADQTYARFLRGDWTGLDAKDLPKQYADLVRAKDEAAANQAAAAIEQPLPRLIAVGLLFRQNRAMPTSLASAADTASERGWRRPLLAWLDVQRERARAAGDATSVERLEKRIRFIEGPAKPGGNDLAPARTP